MLFYSETIAQQDNNKSFFNQANNGLNKVSTAIAVFQPYLLKARQLFLDAKQLGQDVRNSAKNTLGNNNPNNAYQSNNNGYPSSSNTANYQNSSTNNDFNNSNSNSSNQASYNNNSSYPQNPNNNNSYNQNNSGTNNNYTPSQNYLMGQNLPINNPSTINNDGSGNWGNQNNGLYGNCLDVMTGNVMGMGEAAQSPTSVDLMFFAPSDGQNTYYLMTPGFAKNNSTSTYMTMHTSDQVMQWNDINESEVALTKLSIGQFNQIQNNNQIQSAVRNAQNYSENYSSVGQKLDGKVFAVKVQMDNREVYALVAVLKQMGTSGNNGYLKIQIKTTGLANSNGQINVNAYLR